MFKRLLIMSLLASLYYSCTFDDPNPPKAVDFVDIERFMGKWYVISCIPTAFEKNIYNAVENYSLNEDGYIDVDFTFNKDSFVGPKKSIKQKAFIFNTETNSEWRIQLFWPLKFPYLVIDLDDEYSYTVIAVPDRSHVWIMARTSKMDPETYEKVLNDLDQEGFDLTKLEKIQHRVNDSDE